MAGVDERQKEWQNGRMADVMVEWQTEWQNSGNGGWNGQMVGMVKWQEWRTEWSNGRQKRLHTYYLWYTPTTPTTTTTTTTTPFNLLYYRHSPFQFTDTTLSGLLPWGVGFGLSCMAISLAKFPLKVSLALLF